MSGFTQLSHNQIQSWRDSIELIKQEVCCCQKSDSIQGIVLEYRIPRREKRLDCAIIGKSNIIIIEFKVGSSTLDQSAIDQGVDYALDIANYHERSHGIDIHLIICPTEYKHHNKLQEDGADKIASIQACGSSTLNIAVDNCLNGLSSGLTLEAWVLSNYKPIPGILESVNILFSKNSSEDINACLSTSEQVDDIVSFINKEIDDAIRNQRKKLLIVTGVPGSGKTLVGLKLAHTTRNNGEHSTVYMSGNGPLLKVIKESLARNYAEIMNGITLKKARRHSEALLHSVHSFIDESRKTCDPPSEQVVIFDEAQRAWDKKKMLKMNSRQRRFSGNDDIEFDEIESEPLTLINVMSRLEDGAVIVALCGTGQEIHDGEAGVGEWLESAVALKDWKIITSDQINLSETTQNFFSTHMRMSTNSELHLDIPLRSHRAKNHSLWVDSVLNGHSEDATKLINIQEFPIYLSRSLDDSRKFLESSNLGTRRFGILASSGAARLRRYGLEVSADFRKGIDYPLWFTGPKGDIRASYALETAATEFECQGLEIDWAIVAWSWDLLISETQLSSRSFRGTKWSEINTERERSFLLNKYRVLLTRAREGMIIFVPNGSTIDSTRSKAEIDLFANYLERCGVRKLSI